MGSEWQRAGGGIEPLPVILRQVSGKKARKGIKNVVDEIRQNQKIHCQPAYCASSPPITGAKLGAMMMATEA